MPGQRNIRWGTGQWGQGSPLCSMTIDVALAAGPLDLTQPGRRWGETRWGQPGWDGITGTLPGSSPAITIEMAGGLPLNRYPIGGDCSLEIEVLMAGAVPTEITLPPPQSLRVAAWLRPAL